MDSPVGAFSVAEVCRELFADYPLAVTPISHDGAVRSMVLMVRDADGTVFFDLTQHGGCSEPLYSLCPCGSGDVVDFSADSTPAPPDLVGDAVSRGVPIPRHGSLWGWRNGDMLAALVTVYAGYRPEHSEPGWAVLPLADIPRAQWPPFTGEPQFGWWFWSYNRDGRIVSLADLLAETSATVFWTTAEAPPGRNFCVVARDIKSPEGYVLCSGSYVYYRVLLSDHPSPSLDTVLSRTDLIDLAPRLCRLANDY
jgi:hypothetical protein